MKKPPVRFWIAMMIFLTTVVNYMGRVHMSLSIISMVKEKSGKVHQPECSTSTHNDTQNFNATLPDYGPRYPWEQHTQGLVLAGYFYGYMVTCLPAGLISEWWGADRVILYTTLIQGIFTSLTAPAAYIHWSVVFIARFIIGMMGGLTYPAAQCLIAHWAPPQEKGKFLGAMMGHTLGTVITFPLVGLVTSSLGWAWGFYVLGLICFAFCVLTFFVVSDRPESHKWISDDEKNYIVSSLEGISSKKSVPPYRKILTSMSFWAIAFAQFGNLWDIYLVATGVPKFIAEVLGFDLKDSGFLSALPYLSCFIFGQIFGVLGDYVKKRGFSATCIRKFFTLFSHVIPATLLFMIVFVGCNWKAVMGFIILCQGLNGAIAITHLMNPQDLAPNFAGTLYGMMSFFGGISGFLVPSVTATLISKHNGLAEWHINFIIGGVVYSLSGIIFIIFGSGQVQPWNEKLET